MLGSSTDEMKEGKEECGNTHWVAEGEKDSACSAERGSGVI
jgi:hypothetical protein